jgi:hypothetical protein
VSPDLIRDFDERWWTAAKKVGILDANSGQLTFREDCRLYNSLLLV